MDKEIRYFVNGYEMLLYLSGDREERKSVDCFELQDFESEEEAVAAARDFISEHKNAVNDQKHGIGSVTYWVVIMRLYRIPKGRRVGGLGIRQREALVALERNGWKL